MEKNKIPNADEYFKSIVGELPDNVDWSIKDAMIGFAKLHVKQALETAAEEAKLEMYETWIDKQSILNAYPEDLIQ